MSNADRKALKARIDAARTRGEQKLLGKWLDQQEPAVRLEVIAIAAEAGEVLPDEAVFWPGKKLVRRARGRQSGARERKNPIRRDEAFTCAVCGTHVPLGGARVRDHCPSCLSSLHVDRVPGDRAANCGGVLVPMMLDRHSGQEVIAYECDLCGHQHRCRVHPEDSRGAVVGLSLPSDLLPGERRYIAGLPRRVAEFCARERLIRGSLAVAVSGGVDSMVLMHVLAVMGHRPVVVAFDHGLREASAREVDLVQREASGLGFEFKSINLEVHPGPNLAERARLARYEAMEELNFDGIALGHHQDDQAETVIDRLMRGGGSRGLAGIPSARGQFIRPLMEESRKSILAWAKQRGIPHVEDPSNSRGTRGRIRHEILPVMRELRSGTAAAIARTASHLREDEDLLHRQAEGLLSENGIEWPLGTTAPPRPLLRRAILELIRRARGDAAGIGAAQITQIAEFQRAGAWLDVGGGYRAVREPDCIRVVPAPPDAAELQSGEWGIWRIEASVPVWVRTVQEGEDGGGTPLRERLRTAGVAQGLRDLHPVVVVNGRRWLPGVWLEPAEQDQGVRVLCECPIRASIPPGGPYTSEL